ncbi:hypothetical protein TRFO_04765 [Tritrichomonas foetus]|uniref:Protein kinase domain-containing protein n=1 Tax=Tritrichomonas foetus TaxID=1144522 RepID=A0A1J4KBA6_9EUKA|nr:hypothetical protein TRFO_04765 [Tritrichomonas foetus]|eukprot:OHT08695.1 hypothetical protein TRFO_04765 [Tritrichomonas foetus]
MGINPEEIREEVVKIIEIDYKKIIEHFPSFQNLKETIVYLNSSNINSSNINSSHINSSHINSSHINSSHINSSNINSSHKNLPNIKIGKIDYVVKSKFDYRISNPISSNFSHTFTGFFNCSTKPQPCLFRVYLLDQLIMFKNELRFYNEIYGKSEKNILRKIHKAFEFIVCEESRSFILCLEDVERISIEKIIQDRQKSQAPDAEKLYANCVLNFLSDLEEAVNQMHKMDIYHRNISPNTVFLRMTCETDKVAAIVTDFSHTLQAKNSKVNYQKQFGFLNYRHPNLLKQNRQIDLEAIDKWAIACIGLDLIEKKSPFFEGNNSKTVLNSIRNAQSKITAMKESFLRDEKDIKLKVYKKIADLLGNFNID